MSVSRHIIEQECLFICMQVLNKQKAPQLNVKTLRSLKLLFCCMLAPIHRKTTAYDIEVTLSMKMGEVLFQNGLELSVSFLHC